MCNIHISIYIHILNILTKLQPKVWPMKNGLNWYMVSTALPGKTQGPLRYLFLDLHYKRAAKQPGRYNVDLFYVAIFAQVPCVVHLKITIQGSLCIKPVCSL